MFLLCEWYREVWRCLRALVLVEERLEYKKLNRIKSISATNKNKITLISIILQKQNIWYSIYKKHLP